MDKEEFKQILANNKNYSLQASRFNFREPSEEDDELSWRLFQLFPGHWSDQARGRALGLLITHLVTLVCSLNENNIPREQLPSLVVSDLKEKNLLLSHRYAKHFVDLLFDLDLLNT